MKKVLLALFIGLTLNAAAQEKDANTFKNEGNEAYKNKDFTAAFNAYTEALKLLDAEGTVDEALIYNAGYCAYKAGLEKEALPYFQKSIELAYKESKPYQMVAVIQYKLDDIDGMIETCNKGLEKYTDDDKLKDYASKAYLKKGLDFYNVGNDIKSKANESGWNETDPDKFIAEYAKADEEFKKALPFMEKSYEYDSTNDKALKALENIYTNLKMTEKAEEVKAKLETM
jgi:tetratricopeptide (TPR) repeat protein